MNRACFSCIIIFGEESYKKLFSHELSLGGLEDGQKGLLPPILLFLTEIYLNDLISQVGMNFPIVCVSFMEDIITSAPFSTPLNVLLPFRH